MKHLVQKIYKFFYDNPSLEKHKTLSDFLDTLPGFRIEEDNGISRIDMNLANYVSSICKQMANDMLLIPVKTNPTFCLPHVYYPIGARGSRILNRGEVVFGQILFDEEAVHRGGSAESGDAVLLEHGKDVVRVEAIEVVGE